MKKILLSLVAVAGMAATSNSAHAAPFNIGPYGRPCSAPGQKYAAAWGVGVWAQSYGAAYWGAYSNANPPGVLQYSNYCEAVLRGQAQYTGINAYYAGGFWFLGYSTVYCCRGF